MSSIGSWAKLSPSNDCRHPFAKAGLNSIIEDRLRRFRLPGFPIYVGRGRSKNVHGRFCYEAYAKSQNSSAVSLGPKNLFLKESISSGGKKFLFHTEGAGQVKATVEKVEKLYVVEIQASLPYSISANEHCVLLHWGLFRSDSSDWVLLGPEAVPAGTSFVTGQNNAMQTAMQLEQGGVQKLRIELDADLAPFFISFVFFRSSNSKAGQEWIRSSTRSNFSIPVGLDRGCPEPLGLSYKKNNAANFSFYSKNATNVTLCLYKAGDSYPSLEIDLDSLVNRTGDVWHVQLQNVERFSSYGYRCNGEISWDRGNRFLARNVLLDPYAKVLSSIRPGGESLSMQGLLGSLERSYTFDWENDHHPCIPMENLVAYRLDVEGFTKDEFSGVSAQLQGTFLGLIEKIPYFLKIGVNAVILKPLFAHDQNADLFSPFSFFVPMELRKSVENSNCTSDNFKKMVKELHKNGIEVILDVVYSHTAEKGDESPENISFRGIDNATYYICDQYGKLAKSDYGAENMFNCNHPTVHKMILDSLRHWVENYHVDGFCFMHAQALLIGPHLQALSRPLLMEAISFDPLLAKTKLIAEFSSSLVGNRKKMAFPHWKRWSELNFLFCDGVQRFTLGEKGKLSDFATRLCGSGDLFADGRGPSFSMNSISSVGDAPDALLSSHNGEETIAANLEVLDPQVKQVRNLFMILFLSQGVPVLNMGDEYSLLKVGSFGEIGRQSYFQWNALKSNFGQEITHLISSLSRFRLRYKGLLQRSKFLQPEELRWHGSEPDAPAWENSDSCFLAMSLKRSVMEDGEGSSASELYIAFNSHEYAVIATLPKPSQGATWHQIADTSLPHPENFLAKGKPIIVEDESSLSGKYEVLPFSVVLLEALHVEYDEKMKPSLSTSPQSILRT